MRIHVRTSALRGAILPQVAISMVALLGFVALAIDLGMVMVAKTQTQNAADAAAFAAARTLTGGANPNTTQSTANGQAAAAANGVLGKSVPAANVTITHGAYHYNPATQSFSPQFPPVAPDNYKMTITRTRAGPPPCKPLAPPPRGRPSPTCRPLLSPPHSPAEIRLRPP
jgi:Flp pilus assembly protein TadG